MTGSEALDIIKNISISSVQTSNPDYEAEERGYDIRYDEYEEAIDSFVAIEYPEEIGAIEKEFEELERYRKTEERLEKFKPIGIDGLVSLFGKLTDDDIETIVQMAFKERRDSHGV